MKLNKEFITKVSKLKNEPKWMLEFRLKSFEKFLELDNPNFGPHIDIDFDNINYYKKELDLTDDWNKVDDNLRTTFKNLGVIDAENNYLCGVSNQVESEVFYHKLKDNNGVIFLSTDEALKEYPEMFKEYFNSLVKYDENKYTALNGCLWSGGSFIYIPKGVKLDRPLQSYFRLNEKGAGQFEHTLIIVDEGAELQFIEGCSAPGYNELNLHAGCVELFVKKNAYLRFSTIENWSKNMLNLNTKKCYVEENGKIEWIMGSFGSKVSMLYPLSVLNGKNAKCEFTNISFAGHGQNLDTGLKIIHNAENTSSIVNSKSISKDGGICTFRSNVHVRKNATNSSVSLSCESLMMDSISRSDTIPANTIETDDVSYAHEATIGKISDEAIYYLMTRGMSEEDAKSLIVRGFAEPIAKAFPVEYAVEMNRLIELELEGTIG